MPTRTGHLYRTTQEPRDESLHRVQLGRIDQVNENIRLFRLMLESPIKFSAGQWLDTYVPETAKVGGFTITSTPSAASSSSPSPYLELAVQRSPESPPAAWLWRPVDEILGSTLHVRVGGSFVFPPPALGDSMPERLVLVAGGVGINPLMSMLSFMAEQAEPVQATVEVLYATKVPRRGVRDILFVDRIAALFAQGRLRGHCRLFLTGPSAATSERLHASVERRRFNSDDLVCALGTHEKDHCVAYVCGPPAMTDNVVGIFTEKNGIDMDSRRVLTEKWW